MAAEAASVLEGAFRENGLEAKSARGSFMGRIFPHIYTQNAVWAMVYMEVTCRGQNGQETNEPECPQISPAKCRNQSVTENVQDYQGNKCAPEERKLNKFAHATNLRESSSANFSGGGIKPRRASGTRWIGHKVNALKLLVDKCGIYKQHLESLRCDLSVKAADKAKLKVYLRKWRPQICLPPSAFLLTFSNPQHHCPLHFKKLTDTVAASSAMAKAKRQLASSMEKEPDKMPTMKHCFSKVEKDTNQAVQLKNAALDEVRKRASFYVPPQMLRHLKQTAMKTTAFSVIKELD
ncbi:hypothetical protein OS493_019959 [Desmophyllum pertusum]|uniref:Uncharacterized protein n=1 Tax=Desmophyllum pertusum TaxID=174260 RepID=A0A9X0CKD7_9CNID|nr:hypothetical protein OS493_019959 [Desmophyllum pertusum]